MQQPAYTTSVAQVRKSMTAGPGAMLMAYLVSKQEQNWLLDRLNNFLRNEGAMCHNS